LRAGFPTLRFERKSATLLFLFFMLGAALVGVSPVQGQDTETKVVNAETGGQEFVLYTNLTSTGAFFNVTIRVDDVEDLFAFQVLLFYDSSLINASRAWVPTWDSEYVFNGKTTTPVTMFYYDDPQYGYAVNIGDAILVGETFAGSGLLAIIEFEVIYTPNTGEVSCDLEIDNSDTYLLDSSAVNEITTVKTDGHYRLIWVERLSPFLEVKPSRYEASGLELFNITIWINNTVTSQRLVNVTFRLNYNDTLLNVTDVTEGPFLSGFGSTTFVHQETPSNVTVLNYLDTYTSFPDGNGILAEITFEGIYRDAQEHSCRLKIEDVYFLNDDSEPIASSLPVNGLYKVSPATSQITIVLSKQTVIVGSNVTISGSIQPAKGDAEVTVYYKPSFIVHVDWAALAIVTTDASGDYEYTWTANRTFSNVNYTSFEMYASWLGDQTVIGAESQRVVLTANQRETSTITMVLDPGTVAVLGENITITGSIQPKHTSVDVTIEYRPTGQTDWFPLGTAKTDTESSYSFVWVSPEVGKYDLRVTWAGDADTEPASKTTAVEVVETAPVDIMAYLPYVLAVIVILIALAFIYFKWLKK